LGEKRFFSMRIIFLKHGNNILKHGNNIWLILILIYQNLIRSSLNKCKILNGDRFLKLIRINIHLKMSELYIHK
jgi:hypothetical protein